MADITLNGNEYTGVEEVNLPLSDGSGMATFSIGVGGVGIESIEQTYKSEEDDGNNVLTITLTNGETLDFFVQNGSKGSTGAQGKPGPEGRGLQTDWNQNDSAADDHLKNRPFYGQLLLPYMSMNASEMPGLSVFLPGEFQQIAKNYGFHLGEGRDYAVNYDGVLYSLKAFVCTYNSGIEVVTIGNPGLILLTSPGSEIDIPDGAGADVPFAFWYNGSNGGLYCETGGTHSFTVNEVVKLPNEYLDLDYIKNGMSTEEWTFEMEDGTTVTKQVMVK